MSFLRYPILLSSAALVASLLSACGGSHAASDPGDGGGACAPPRCFTDFGASHADCNPMGACVQQIDSTGGDICWANGTKVRVTIDAEFTTATGVVTSPDGRACFSYDQGLSQGGPITYRDNLGQLIVRVKGNADGSLTVECAGQPAVTYPSSCLVSQSMMNPMASTMCTMGVCS